MLAWTQEFTSKDKPYALETWLEQGTWCHVKICHARCRRKFPRYISVSPSTPYKRPSQGRTPVTDSVDSVDSRKLRPHDPPPLGQYPSAYYIILYSSTQPSCISHNYIINQLKSCFMRVSNMLQHQQSLATAGQSVHPAQKLHKPQLILEFWFSFDFPPQYASITDLELLVIETIHTRSSMTFRKFSSHSYIVLR